MVQSRPDVIRILKLEKEYHADQIKRINSAITMLQTQKSTRAVRWTSEIKKVFNHGGVYTIKEVRNKLIEKGFVEAMEEKNIRTINTIFSRLKKDGVLEQPQYRKYQKKPINKKEKL